MISDDALQLAAEVKGFRILRRDDAGIHRLEFGDRVMGTNNKARVRAVLQLTEQIVN